MVRQSQSHSHRSRHQLPLPLPRTWGGSRKNAGRKRAPGTRPPAPHRTRPVHRKGEPVHVTLRARPGIPSLRGGVLFSAVRASLAAASKPAFRLVQFSVQADHLHLLVEGSDKRSLALGLRGLAIRVARAVNRVRGRPGKVWGDRYHARALAKPREVRNALVYVLMNFRKHLRHQPRGLDPCSSAPWFDGFRDVQSTHLPRAPDRPETPPVAASRTWLASVGWRRHGLIGVHERPAGAE
jgi:putative transposase